MTDILISVGEALDKYLILTLKENRIPDKDKLSYITTEKKILDEKLIKYMSNSAIVFYCSILYWINDIVWKNCDLLRNYSYNIEGYNHIVKKIIEFNDARSRIKHKINHISKSIIQDQKSYINKKCVLYSHLGFGDQYNIIGAVRFISLFFDEVRLVIREDQRDLIPLIYFDDPCIKYISCTYRELFENKFELIENGNVLSPSLKENSVPLYWLGKSYQIIMNGEVLENTTNATKYMKKFTTQFYDEIASQIHQPLRYSLRFLFSYLPRNKENEEKEIAKHNLVNKDYIFLHDNPPLRKIKINNSHNYYIFSPSYNYNNEKDWKGRSRMLDTLLIIENAKEIHVIDSSFFCMINVMNIPNNISLHYYGYFEYEEYTNPTQRWTYHKLTECLTKFL